MEKKENTGKVFLIAGSEPLGSAGVQADIKAITRCGGWAAAALTCIVDEDVNRIKSIYHLPTELIVSQAESFLSTVGADCIKTGILPTDGIILAVASVLRRFNRQPILIDPVIVNFAGEQLVSDEAIAAYKSELFPLATLSGARIQVLFCISRSFASTRHSFLRSGRHRSHRHRRSRHEACHHRGFHRHGYHQASCRACHRG